MLEDLEQTFNKIENMNVKTNIILNYSNKKKTTRRDMEDIEYNYQKRQEMFKLPR